MLNNLIKTNMLNQITLIVLGFFLVQYDKLILLLKTVEYSINFNYKQWVKPIQYTLLIISTFYTISTVEFSTTLVSTYDPVNNKGHLEEYYAIRIDSTNYNFYQYK